MSKLDIEVVFFHVLNAVAIGETVRYSEIRKRLGDDIPLAEIARAVNANKTRFYFEEEKHKWGSRKLITRKF